MSEEVDKKSSLDLEPAGSREPGSVDGSTDSKVNETPKMTMAKKKIKTRLYIPGSTLSKKSEEERAVVLVVSYSERKEELVVVLDSRERFTDNILK
jgi:hypothetical protein